jgi:hypothetical protein
MSEQIAQSAEPAAKARPRLYCPHCGADDVRKVSLMYEQATSNLNFRALSMGNSVDGTYTAGHGGLQNLMGGRIAPPVAPVAPSKPWPPVMSAIWTAIWGYALLHIATQFGTGGFSGLERHTLLGWVGVAFGLLCMFPLVIFVPLYLFAMSNYQRDAATYRDVLLPQHQASVRRWSSSWMCMRCGDLFQPK